MAVPPQRSDGLVCHGRFWTTRKTHFLAFSARVILFRKIRIHCLDPCLPGREMLLTQPTPPVSQTRREYNGRLHGLTQLVIIEPGKMAVNEAKTTVRLGPQVRTIRPTRRVAALLGFLLKAEVDAIFQQQPFETLDGAGLWLLKMGSRKRDVDCRFIPASARLWAFR